MSTPKSSGAVLSSKIATQTVSGETCRLLDFCCLYRINVRVYGLSYRTKPVGNGMNITRRPPQGQNARGGRGDIRTNARLLRVTRLPQLTSQDTADHSAGGGATYHVQHCQEFYDCGPLGLVEITIVMGNPTSMRCRTKMLRLALRIGSSSELSILAVKKSGANGGVTRSSLYLPRSGATIGPTPSAFDLAYVKLS